MKTKVKISKSDLKHSEFNGASIRKMKNGSDTDESSNALVSKLIYNFLLKENKHVATE